MVREYAWVWAGRRCGWVCVSGASVSTASVAGNSKADEYRAEWSVHAPYMDHGRYKSPATHVDSLGHPHL